MRSFILGTSIFDFGIQRVKNCVQNIETYIIYIYIYFFFIILHLGTWVAKNGGRNESSVLKVTNRQSSAFKPKKSHTHHPIINQSISKRKNAVSLAIVWTWTLSFRVQHLQTKSRSPLVTVKQISLFFDEILHVWL